MQEVRRRFHAAEPPRKRRCILHRAPVSCRYRVQKGQRGDLKGNADETVHALLSVLQQGCHVCLAPLLQVLGVHRALHREPVCERVCARACLREPVCESLSARARLWGNLGENASPDRPRWDMHGSRQSAIQPKPDRDLVRDKQMLRGLGFPARARLGEPVCHTPIVDPLVRLCIPYFNSLLLLLLLMLLLLAS